MKEFYEKFVADDAPYSLPDFHMSRGDWEVRVLFFFASLSSFVSRSVLYRRWLVWLLGG